MSSTSASTFEPSAASRRVLVDREVPFGDEELFFSRTDPHGIIQSGNRVFQRVSGYSWDELTGKPHKIIRHPDMPRAVFWLLWEAIESGQPIGAYVKNRAKDGAYYWVFALVTPEEQGFLSVRLKPHGEIFAAAQKLYAEAVAFEAEDRMEPAVSAARLVGALQAAGFASYAEFMATALSSELRDREDRLGRPPVRPLELLHDVAQASAVLLRSAERIEEACAFNRYMPLNLRVRSAQLGGAGAAIGTVSANYSDIVSELQGRLASFTASAQLVRKAVLDSQFMVGAALIQAQMCDVFGRERDEADFHLAESPRLERQRAHHHGEAAASLRSILLQVERFRSDCSEMSRLAAGLEVTRIMGEVESAGLKERDDALASLLTELAGFQRTLADALRELGQANARIAGLAHEGSEILTQEAAPQTA